MITLIHGNDIAQSRKALENEKTKYSGDESVHIDGKKIDLTDIISACESSSLISARKTIIIENMLSFGVTKPKELILKYLAVNPTLHNIFIWEKNEVDKKILLKYFSKSRIIGYQLPFLLFKFLEAIGSATKSEILSLYHLLLKTRDAEFIYVMMIRQLRYLIIASDLGERGLKDLAFWQTRKFTLQSHYFRLEELIQFYRQLLFLEYQYKTGQTPYNFQSLLDIFLANL